MATDQGGRAKLVLEQQQQHGQGRERAISQDVPVGPGAGGEEPQDFVHVDVCSLETSQRKRSRARRECKRCWTARPTVQEGQTRLHLTNT